MGQLDAGTEAVMFVQASVDSSTADPNQVVERTLSQQTDSDDFPDRGGDDPSEASRRPDSGKRGPTHGSDAWVGEEARRIGQYRGETAVRNGRAVAYSNIDSIARLRIRVGYS